MLLGEAKDDGPQVALSLLLPFPYRHHALYNSAFY